MFYNLGTREIETGEPLGLLDISLDDLLMFGERLYLKMYSRK